MPFAEADLAALGRYVVDYSRLEGILASSISAMLEAAPYAGPMIVSTVSTQKLLKLMTQLAPRYADGDDKERLTTLIKRVNMEADRRTGRTRFHGSSPFSAHAGSSSSMKEVARTHKVHFTLQLRNPWSKVDGRVLIGFTLGITGGYMRSVTYSCH